MQDMIHKVLNKEVEPKNPYAKKLVEKIEALYKEAVPLEEQMQKEYAECEKKKARLVQMAAVRNAYVQDLEELLQSEE